MADRYWVNDDADGLWNVANNWSASSGGAGGAGVPGASDAVYFDSGNTDECVINADVSVASITATSAYTAAGDTDGHIDNATNDQGIAVSGNVTLDNKKVSMGDGTWTVGGDFDWNGVGTFNRNVSTVVMTGTANMIPKNVVGLYTLRIASGANITYDSGGTQAYYYGKLYVDGTLTVNGTKFLSGIDGSDAEISSSGTVAGTGYWKVAACAGKGISVFAADAQATIDYLYYTTKSATSALVAGQYDADLFSISTQAGVAGGLKLSGDYIFTGNVQFSTNAGSSNPMTVDNATNNPNLTFRKNLVIVENGEALTWTKGTGNITFSGTADQDIDFDGKAVEDIEIDKSAGNLVMTGAVQTDSFTGTSTGTGDFDPNGQTITVDGNCSWAAVFDFDSAADVMNGCSWVVDGNFTCDGQSLKATAGWSLEVAGTAVASGTGDVVYSDADATHTEIDATAGPWTNNGNNTNWKFGGNRRRRMILFGAAA